MIKNVLASVAAAGLALAPIAAQANTRAVDAGVMIDRAPLSVSNAAFLANDDDDDEGGLWLWLGLIVITAGVLLAIAGDTSEGDDASPGTGG